MKREELNLLLESMTYETEYRFLETAKDAEELMDVAASCGLKLPARDLAIFKGRYAVTDKVNRNGCNLPMDEVEKSLATLKGKAVDFDHLRKRVVGHWLKAELDGEQIISYAVFYKGNFPEDYETIQQLMSEGNLKISFEAYGKRTPIAGTNDYDLTDIEFAGGALLIKDQPAEPTAEVLELAKVMTAPTEYIHTGKLPEKENKGKDMSKDKVSQELARLHTHDMEMMMRLLHEVEDNKGNPIIVTDILRIDFEMNTIWIRGVVENDGEPETDGDGRIVFRTYEVDLTPRSKVIENAQKIVRIREVEPTRSKEVTTDNGTNGKEKVVQSKTEVSTMEKTEEQVKESQVKAQKESEVLTAKIKELETALAASDEKVKSLSETVSKYQEAERAAKLAERRKDLGDETAKDMSDEDVLDDEKFTVAKKDKEIAELKAKLAKKDPDGGSVREDGTTLETGSKDKETEDAILAAGKRVDEIAFGKQDAE